MATSNMTTVTRTPAVDMLAYGCVNNFHSVACVRRSALAVVSVLTVVLCVIKVFRLHCVRHDMWHHYFIFYCAVVECTMASVHFLLSTFAQFDFVLQWLKLSQFLVMYHFYWTRATIILRREDWTKRYLLPFLTLACTYFTAVTIVGIVYAQDAFVECIQPYWIMMSSAEFGCVQLFFLAVFYINRRLNEISMLVSVRRAQKWNLWSIVVVFEISALFGFIYDLTMEIIGNTETGCSAIFGDIQEIYSLVYSLFMLTKLFLPVWVMLLIFHPMPGYTVTNELASILSDDWNSLFTEEVCRRPSYNMPNIPRQTYNTFVHETCTCRPPIPRSLRSAPRTNIAVPINCNVTRPTLSNLRPVLEESSGYSTESADTQSPGIQSRGVQSPGIQSGGVQSPAIQSPEIQSHGVQSPAVHSPAVQSPAVQSSYMLTSGVQSLEWQYPKVQSTDAQSVEWQSRELPYSKVQSSYMQTPGIQSLEWDSLEWQYDGVHSAYMQPPGVLYLQWESPEVKPTDVQSHEWQSPGVQSPYIQSPEVQTLEVQSLEEQFPDVYSVEWQSPRIQSDIQTPGVQFLEVQSLYMQYPEVQSPEWQLPGVHTHDMHSTDIQSFEVQYRQD